MTTDQGEPMDSTTGAEGLAKRMWIDPTSKEPGFYGEDHYTGYFDYSASDSPNPGPGAVEYIKADSLRCKHGIRWPHECSDCFHETFPDRAEQAATIAALRQTVERLERPHTDVAYRQRMITQLRAVGQAEAADMIASLDARNCDIDDDRAVLRSQVEALREASDRMESAIRWALGEKGSFRPPKTAPGAQPAPFWWRKTLRRLAALQGADKPGDHP